MTDRSANVYPVLPTNLTRPVAGAGHFLQEDRPAEIAALINDFISSTR